MKKFLSISVFVLSSLYSNSQNCQWAHNIGSDWGSAQGIVTVDIAVDANNNTIVAGSFIGTADFDPGSSVASLTAGPQGNGFIAKYDAAGNFLWAKTFFLPQ